MPTIKSWSGRIPLILQHLETDTWRFYPRRDVEVLFGVGRSQAIDLMHIAGADVRNGAQTTATRENLRYYVERCPEAQAYLDEQDRKRKLATRLQQTSEELRQRAIPIPGVEPEDEWVKWVDLPHVRIEPGLMLIAFDGFHGLLHSLWMISRAMENEPEALRGMCADPATAEAPCGDGDRVAADSPVTAA